MTRNQVDFCKECVWFVVHINLRLGASFHRDVRKQDRHGGGFVFYGYRAVIPR
jgi:hypothetical protein